MKVSEALAKETQPASNMDWLRVLAFGVETQAVQGEPRVTPVIFEVMP